MKGMGHPARILIVEDEAIISLDIKRLLSSSGYLAAVTATSDQAIRAIDASAPDLVLMDIQIKGPVDGIDTASQIRKKFRVPVVFVTAHADKKTLERARETQPFGYIVKPISALSLTSTIEMALHKHRTEQQLEEHRSWLGTVLQNIPDAVLVTDLSGEVQFLNSAAEMLTGLKRSEIIGKPVDSVLAIWSGDQGYLASQLIDKAEWGSRTSLPREALLQLPSKDVIRVEGDVVISYSNGQPIGAIFTLRDISHRAQEEKILRHEERMLALGQFTSGIAGDFNCLHSLLSSTCNDLFSLAENLASRERAILLDKTDTISRASAMGLLMASQLSQLSAPPAVRATFVSASGVVASVEPLLNKMRGPSLQVDIRLTDESTLILCHPGRLQMLLLNVFLNARERMAGAGRLCISTSQTGGRVRILFELEHLGISAWEPLSFPLEMDNPDFSLSIAQAIVTAMEGSIVFHAISETQGSLEILLPLQYGTLDVGAAGEQRSSVLLIGSDLDVLGKVEDRLEEDHYAVIRCSSAAEALLLGQLHDGKIDCVIIDGESVSGVNRRKLRTFFGSRNARTQFVCLTPADQPDEPGWESLPKSSQLSSLERLNNLLKANNLAMGAAS
jgi:PAS domain S-box-containing protein